MSGKLPDPATYFPSTANNANGLGPSKVIPKYIQGNVVCDIRWEFDETGSCLSAAISNCVLAGTTQKIDISHTWFRHSGK